MDKKGEEKCKQEDAIDGVQSPLEMREKRQEKCDFLQNLFFWQSG